MYRYNVSSNQFSFRSDTPLTNDQIARHAPSVLATEAHGSRSEQYKIVPTIDVLNNLREEGFQPFEVRQTKVRNPDRRDHTRHMVRLRHPDMVAAAGDTPEIVLLNSHDGTSSFQLIAGFFRMICSNGMITGDVTNDIRIRHTGNVVEEVVQGSYQILENIEMLESRIDLFRTITLDEYQQHLFAQAVAAARWGTNSPLRNVEDVLFARRFEDRGNTLWNTLNRAQENMIKGGLGGRSATGRRTRTRQVGGVNQDVEVNRKVWSIADKFADAEIQKLSVEELHQSLVLEVA